MWSHSSSCDLRKRKIPSTIEAVLAQSCGGCFLCQRNTENQKTQRNSFFEKKTLLLGHSSEWWEWYLQIKFSSVSNKQKDCLETQTSRNTISTSDAFQACQVL